MASLASLSSIRSDMQYTPIRRATGVRISADTYIQDQIYYTVYRPSTWSREYATFQAETVPGLGRQAAQAAEQDYESCYVSYYSDLHARDRRATAERTYSAERKRLLLTLSDAELRRMAATAPQSLEPLRDPRTGRLPTRVYAAIRYVAAVRAERTAAKPKPKRSLVERLERRRAKHGVELAAKRGHTLFASEYQGSYRSPWGLVLVYAQTYPSYRYKAHGHTFTHVPASQAYLVGSDDGGPWCLPARDGGSPRETYLMALPIEVRRALPDYVPLRQGDVFVVRATRATNSKEIEGTRHTVVDGMLTHPEHAPVTLPPAYRLVRAVARLSHGAVRAAD